MLNLVITILILTYFTVCFKWYEKYKVDNFSAIIINYITAGLIGFFLSPKSNLVNAPGFNALLIYGATIGALFIVVFNLVAESTQKTGIAITVLFSKLSSIILPVSFAFIFKDTTVSIYKLIALGLAVGSLFLIFNLKQKNNTSKVALLMLAGIFIGQGSADILFNKSEEVIFSQHADSLFSIIFLCAGFFGLIFSFFTKQQRFKPTLKNLLFGLLLGVPNYFSLVFFFKALSELDESVAFPILNIGIIILSTLLGAIFYNEKITSRIALGILLAAASLFLITLK